MDNDNFEKIMKQYIDAAPRNIQEILSDYVRRWDDIVSMVYSFVVDGEEISEQKFRENIESIPTDIRFDYIIRVYQQISEGLLKSHSEGPERFSDKVIDIINKEINSPVIRVESFKISGNGKPVKNGHQWICISEIVSETNYACWHIPSGFSTYLSNKQCVLIKVYEEEYLNEIKDGDLFLLALDEKIRCSRCSINDNEIIFHFEDNNRNSIVINKNVLTSNDELYVIGIIAKAIDLPTSA